MKMIFLLRSAIFLLTLCLVGLNTYAQVDRTELEREREYIQQEIKQIQGQYDKVKGQRRKTLGQLNLIQRKINLQNKYISNISREIRYINDNIYLSNVELFRLQKQLDTLKAHYARSLVYAYKHRSTYDFLNFIFSAGSFTDAMKRVAYLKNYRKYRQEQLNTILETQKQIQQRMAEQVVRRQQKDDALKNQSVQAKALEGQKKEKDAVARDLRGQEKELQKELNAKKKRDASLKNAIAAIVRRELEKAEAEAKAAAKSNTATTGTNTDATPSRPSANKSYLDLNARDVALNNNFEQNRGKLPWPVDNGFVSIGFGRKEYAIEGNSKPLIMDNPGITITTPSVGTTVKAVFDGEVARVFNLGDVQVVTVRHGKYFTVYSNLSSVSVSNGQQIKTGQSIGRAAQSDDGAGGQIDFMLMIEKKNVNPEGWLRR